MMMNDEELNKEADSGKSESAFYILFAIQLILIAIGMFMPIQMDLPLYPCSHSWQLSHLYVAIHDN